MRQQRLLHPIFAIDEPTHRPPPKPSSSGILKQIRSERNPIAPKSQAVFTQAGPIADMAKAHEKARKRLLGEVYDQAATLGNCRNCSFNRSKSTGLVMNSVAPNSS